MTRKTNETKATMSADYFLLLPEPNRFFNSKREFLVKRIIRFIWREIQAVEAIKY